MHRMVPVLLALVVCCAACGDPRLSDQEKWWLTPPASATRIAFEQDGKWGYKDQSGAVVIPPQFDSAAHFPGKADVLLQDRADAAHVTVRSHALGRVKIDGRWGYIDEAGTMVIPPRFDEAMDFYEDLTAVRQGAKWGFIDGVGRMAILPQYDEASPFLLGVAHVRRGRTWLIINRDNESISEEK